MSANAKPPEVFWFLPVNGDRSIVLRRRASPGKFGAGTCRPASAVE
jgi:hypothetical protein